MVKFTIKVVEILHVEKGLLPIETQRCTLARLQQADVEDIKRLYTNEKVREYLGGPWTEEAAAKTFANLNVMRDGLHFVIREKETHHFIGLLSLETHHDGRSTEISYQLLPEWWGAGYATEAMERMINYAFTQLNLAYLVAETQTANIASCKLLQKLGMEERERLQRFGAEQVIYYLQKEHVLYEVNDLKVRHLQQEDQHILAKWLSTPTVLEFYEGRDNPHDVEKVRQKFYNRENGVFKCMVEFEGQRIGYIQYYEVNDETSDIADYPEEEIVYGMDQFIGETDFWNRGIGTLLVTTMVHYLIEQKQADRVIMDPQTTNIRALKCYEKCGFKKVRILADHEFHEGEYRDCWLIEYRRAL